MQQKEGWHGSFARTHCRPGRAHPQTRTRHRGNAASMANQRCEITKACRRPSVLKDRSCPLFHPSNPSARQPNRCTVDHPRALVVSRPPRMQSVPKNVLPPLILSRRRRPYRQRTLPIQAFWRCRSCAGLFARPRLRPAAAPFITQGAEDRRRDKNGGTSNSIFTDFASCVFVQAQTVPNTGI